MKERVSFKLNGKSTEVFQDSDRTLLWTLRTTLKLTGTKYGCGESHCGSCTVLVNDQARLSCQLTLKDIANTSIVTIEGLAKNGDLHPVQKAFMENDALQCGYCTPGMILKATSLLSKIPDPTDEQIIAGMESNLCRCGAHKRIIEAIHLAAKEMKGSSNEKR